VTAPASERASSPSHGDDRAVAKPAVPASAPSTARKPAGDDAARAQALLEGKPAAANGRFIVQVGAFADAGAAREARLKVERLGLKTYTQAVDTPGGKRIRVRVGPFASRDEADKAASKLKSGGLASAVLTL
jgi:DedD protein